MQAVIYVWSYRRRAAAAPGSGDESQGLNRWISHFPSHRAGDGGGPGNGGGPGAGTRSRRPRAARGSRGENLQNSRTGAAVAFWGQAVQRGLGRYSIQ